jgi:amidase
VRVALFRTIMPRWAPAASTLAARASPIPTTSSGLLPTPAPDCRQPWRRSGVPETGLPIGVQIIVSYLEDSTPIQFAQLLERAFGGFVPPVL